MNTNSKPHLNVRLTRFLYNIHSTDNWKFTFIQSRDYENDAHRLIFHVVVPVFNKHCSGFHLDSFFIQRIFLEFFLLISPLSNEFLRISEFQIFFTAFLFFSVVDSACFFKFCLFFTNFINIYCRQYLSMHSIQSLFCRPQRTRFKHIFPHFSSIWSSSALISPNRLFSMTLRFFLHPIVSTSFTPPLNRSHFVSLQFN